jgi:hypothetical protein
MEVEGFTAIDKAVSKYRPMEVPEDFRAGSDVSTLQLLDRNFSE